MIRGDSTVRKEKSSIETSRLQELNYTSRPVTKHFQLIRRFNPIRREIPYYLLLEKVLGYRGMESKKSRRLLFSGTNSRRAIIGPFIRLSSLISVSSIFPTTPVCIYTVVSRLQLRAASKFHFRSAFFRKESSDEIHSLIPIVISSLFFCRANRA